ncbi:arabinofuranosyltransferase [Actinomadura latina]|uniref:Arabinofuranosyltransferase n=1 Tax=Actinomadura latina TaxID=163603 RepID=A0A846YPU7_9ACTN|nr:arabinofuranosyltransferase [Actinomadura latina]NKZ02191.1 arabinofuranosyltransferase [Actinomadura latina]
MTRPDDPAAGGRRTAGCLRMARRPAVPALLTWLIATPVAMLLPAPAGRSPFSPQGAVLPIGVGGLLLAAGLAVAAARPRRWRSPSRTDALAGVAAGLLAAWVALALRNSLHGTPFGFAGLLGDEGRMSAMATRYSDTAFPSDGIVAGVPTEYPPLFPWVVGRASALLDVHAWQVLGDAQTLTISGAVLLTFLLWTRLVPAPAALAIAAAALVSFADPRKAHEVVALAVFIPWVPATFGRPPRGRLHWLPAGVLGGLVIATYLGFVLWGAAGILALAWLTWRAAGDRRRYLAHLAKVAVVAAVTAAWYLVPYGWTLLRDGGQMVSDEFPAPAITSGLFPFLDATPLGLLQAIGLAGLLWYRRAAWWATPLLCLVAGAYLYRALATARYLVNGHTGLFYHTARMVTVLLAIAGVLTVAHAAPGLVRRLATRDTIPNGLTATAVTVLIGWCGFTYWHEWTPPTTDPATATGTRRYAVLAHTEPRPDGTLPRYAPARPTTRWFPVGPIQKAVTDVLGRDAAPRTLSYDERLFAYLPWPGYIAADRTAASSTTHWDDRRAALAALAAVPDPDAFARAAAHTRFGPIDLFILRADATAWTWNNIHFRPAQFTSAHFTVRSLPNDTVLAIRRVP